MNSDLGWAFTAAIGDWALRTREIEVVEVGRGSYSDIVRSIVPAATRPVEVVERERIERSDGPCCVLLACT